MEWSSTTGWRHGNCGSVKTADLSHFLKQRFFLLMPPRGINNDKVMAGLLELVYTLARNHCWVRLCVGPVEGYLHFCGVLLELVKGTCITYRDFNMPDTGTPERGKPTAETAQAQMAWLHSAALLSAITAIVEGARCFQCWLCRGVSAPKARLSSRHWAGKLLQLGITCSEGICTNECWLEPLLLVEGSILCTGCGLTRSLHTPELKTLYDPLHGGITKAFGHTRPLQIVNRIIAEACHLTTSQALPHVSI